MKKISLILPVYNVELYLPKCIESCLNQDLPKTEYEMIIVIDGQFLVGGKEVPAEVRLHQHSRTI